MEKSPEYRQRNVHLQYTEKQLDVIDFFCLEVMWRGFTLENIIENYWLGIFVGKASLSVLAPSCPCRRTDFEILQEHKITVKLWALLFPMARQKNRGALTRTLRHIHPRRCPANDYVAQVLYHSTCLPEHANKNKRREQLLLYWKMRTNKVSVNRKSWRKLSV